jgi:hypothetical protein
LAQGLLPPFDTWVSASQLASFALGVFSISVFVALACRSRRRTTAMHEGLLGTEQRES